MLSITFERAEVELYQVKGNDAQKMWLALFIPPMLHPDELEKKFLAHTYALPQQYFYHMLIANIKFVPPGSLLKRPLCKGQKLKMSLNCVEPLLYSTNKWYQSKQIEKSSLFGEMAVQSWQKWKMPFFGFFRTRNLF